MCGVAGIFALDGPADIDAALLRRMTGALAHRGPDGEGFHVEPGLGLGSRRLILVDPEGGAQPIYNEDGSVVIVFNGMIYNFPALMEELRRLGLRFRTRCDTETVVHAWEAWGPACLDRLDGPFAFALWDRAQGTLFLARDRMGKKPLYYSLLPDGRFVFGSELAALAPVGGIDRRLDPCAIEDYFAFGYIPDPRTICRGIARLGAAECLLLRRGEPVGAPRRYWRPAITPLAVGEADAVAEARLIADVPLGAFLSGGVDSSGVVAIAAGLRSEPLDTFTIGFEGAEDETPYAAMVAERYGTRQHNERAASIDMIEAARNQGRIYGEPFGDQSAVHTYVVSRLARRHATIALSGDGGDEAFAGYRRYRFHQMTEAARRYLPPAVRRGVVGQLARLYPKLDQAPRWLRAKATLTELSLDSALSYFRTIARVQDERRRGLLAAPLVAELDGYDPSARIAALMAEAGTDDPLAQAQYADLPTWLSGAMLVKVDRASMANSLEVRAPLLDHRLVEWGMSLPARLKLRHGAGKYVLKQALAPKLPAALLNRPKQGFSMSIAGLLRQEQERVRGRVLSPAMLDSGLFDRRGLCRMLDEHLSGRFDHSMPLWLLLVFEGFLAGDAMRGPAPADARAGVPVRA